MNPGSKTFITKKKISSSKLRLSQHCMVLVSVFISYYGLLFWTRLEANTSFFANLIDVNLLDEYAKKSWKWET